jgi:hypothetical protein
MVDFIPYDDDQSMLLLGIPLTVDPFDDGPTLDDVFRYGTSDDNIYDLTHFTREHAILAMQIGEQIAEQIAWNHRPHCPYRVYYNERYVVITGNRSSWSKEAKLVQIESPTILFEILPPGTKKEVWTNKLDRHRRCSTLKICILVSQDDLYVEMYQKATNWKQECISANASIMLDLLNVELPLTSIYEDIL